MDVKTSFLNGLLEEKIYMLQPGGFIEKGNPGRYASFKRSIYGLEQYIIWFFNGGWMAVFIFKSVGGNFPFTLLSLYVDDIVIA